MLPSTDNSNASTPPAAIPGWMFALTVAASFTLGLGLFVALPSLLALWVVQPFNGGRIALNGVEGVIKLAIFVAYVWLIGLRTHIRRLFEYHGAEHKVVYTAENSLPITPASARTFPTPHPRCGTGFALLTVFVSVILFTFLRPPIRSFSTLECGWR
jgi:uncharacterized protein YqhQ